MHSTELASNAVVVAQADNPFPPPLASLPSSRRTYTILLFIFAARMV
jgi:hypothetical protein